MALLLAGCSAALAAPGDLDPLFLSKGGPDGGAVSAIAALGDGSFLIAGDFSSFAEDDRFSGVVKLSRDGVLDETWIPPQADSSIYSLQVQPWDGRVLIGGDFETFYVDDDEFTEEVVARLLPTGILDRPFTAWSGLTSEDVPGAVYAIAPLAAQRTILVGGEFLDSNDRGGIVRLRTSGSRDTDFQCILKNGEDGDAPIVNAIALQADGKILIGGLFDTVNGTARPNIARLTANGGLDSSFAPGVGPDGTVLAIAVQKDGKVVIGGEFTSVNEDERFPYIARLGSNGSVESSFTMVQDPDYDEGLDDAVSAISIQADGKLLVAGAFSTANGLPYSKVARLNPDGSLDRGFRCGGTSGGPDGPVSVVVPLPDGKVIIGGDFEKIGGKSAPRVARLLGGANKVPEIRLTSPNNGATVKGRAKVEVSASDPDGAIVRVELRDAASNDLLGSSTQGSYQFILPAAVTGAVQIRAVAEDNEGAISASAVVSFTVEEVEEVFLQDPRWTPDGFQFAISGVEGSAFRIGTSPDLQAWSPLGLFTNTSGSRFQFLDREASNAAGRFYRVEPAP